MWRFTIHPTPIRVAIYTLGVHWLADHGDPVARAPSRLLRSRLAGGHPPQLRQGNGVVRVTARLAVCHGRAQTRENLVVPADHRKITVEGRYRSAPKLRSEQGKSLFLIQWLPHASETDVDRQAAVASFDNHNRCM